MPLFILMLLAIMILAWVLLAPVFEKIGTLIEITIKRIKGENN